MKTVSKLRRLFMISLWLVVSCTDMNGIREEIDRQNKRLDGLENMVETVNNNTLALDALFAEKNLIECFNEKKNDSGQVIGYVLTLSNGETVEVTFGDKLDVLVPVIGIDQDGNFIFSMDGGETFEIVEGADKATSNDGISPKIDIDNDGYWIVSVDNGNTWRRMLDGNGLPVNAYQANSSNGNAFFTNVTVDNERGVMRFSLKTGKEIEVAIKNLIVFSIAHYTVGDEIRLGETLKYLVDYSNVKEAFFSVPEGWRATLDGESMNVYAPASGEEGVYDIVLTLVSLNNLIKAYTFSFTFKPVAPEIKWRLDWEDEFDKGELDKTVWSVIDRANTTAMRFMSDDPRCYEFRESSIVMKAIVNDNQEKDPVPYLTGGIRSKNLKGFEPGRIEIRARMTNVQGTQPALWTGSWEGITWPWGGEIDIMEHYNTHQHIYQTVHSHYTYDLGFDKDPNPQVKVELNPEEWHIYGVELHENELVFLVDGEKTLSYPRIETTEEGQFPFYSPVYLLLDMQIIGDWGGAVDNENLHKSEIEIDWVRHYLWK